jgi:hypothetical protein
MPWPIRRTADRASGATAPTGRTGTVDRLLPISRLEAFSDGVSAIVDEVAEPSEPASQA